MPLPAWPQVLGGKPPLLLLGAMARRPGQPAIAVTLDGPRQERLVRELAAALEAPADEPRPQPQADPAELRDTLLEPDQQPQPQPLYVSASAGSSAARPPQQQGAPTAEQAVSAAPVGARARRPGRAGRGRAQGPDSSPERAPVRRGPKRTAKLAPSRGEGETEDTGRLGTTRQKMTHALPAAWAAQLLLPGLPTGTVPLHAAEPPVYDAAQHGEHPDWLLAAFQNGTFG